MYCRLAVLMAEKDPRLSQRAVAEQTRLSTATVNKLFLNRFDRVDCNTVEVLCEYLGCEVGELFVLRAAPSPSPTATSGKLTDGPQSAISGNGTAPSPITDSQSPAIPGNGATSPTDGRHHSATSGVSSSQPVEDAPKTLSTGETIHSHLGQGETSQAVPKRGRRKRGGGEGQARLFDEGAGRDHG